MLEARIWRNASDHHKDGGVSALRLAGLMCLETAYVLKQQDSCISKWHADDAYKFLSAQGRVSGETNSEIQPRG